MFSCLFCRCWFVTVVLYGCMDVCRLCKIAQCTTGGVSGTVSMAQLVLRDGLPMYSIDPRTLQVGDYVYVYIDIMSSRTAV